VFTCLLWLTAVGSFDPAPPAASAQLATTEATAPAEANPERMGFPADYFASSNPSSAYDMVMRVPGFRLREADAVRGLPAREGMS